MLKVAISKRPILPSISFQLKKGEVGIFLGKSGVGKSTLLRILCGLESYDRAEIVLDGNEIHPSAHSIGMVFQHFNLFDHLTAEENITLALIKVQRKPKGEAIAIAKKLLDHYELQDKAHIKAYRLSGGQKQRLAIARAVALDPAVLCLDEPTSALDPKLTSQVAYFISEMAQEGKILLIATHDLTFLSNLQGIIFLLEKGQIVQQVSTAEYTMNPTAFPLLGQFLL